MASRSHKPNQNEEYNSEIGVESDIMRNITEGINDIDLSIDQLRREFHKSLDLNRPICNSTSIELNNASRDICHDKIEKVSPMQETKKCCLKIEEVDQQEDKPTNVDLSLSLSPPGGMKSNSKDQNQESSNQSEISSPSSQLSCMSLDMNTINEDLESSSKNQTEAEAEEDLPSLILMGCTHCHIYVMVSEVEPKCPNCMGSVLIDMFRESPAKKSRRN